jgi:hypothetical protein
MAYGRPRVAWLAGIGCDLGSRVCFFLEGRGDKRRVKGLGCKGICYENRWCGVTMSGTATDCGVCAKMKGVC